MFVICVLLLNNNTRRKREGVREEMHQKYDRKHTYTQSEKAERSNKVQTQDE